MENQVASIKFSFISNGYDILNYMKAPKIIIGGVLVIGLIIAGLAIFGNYIDNKNNSNKNNTLTKPPSLKISQSEIISSAKTASAKNNKNQNNQFLEEEELKQISQKITKAVVDLNAQGLTTINNQQYIKALNPQKIINQILQEEISKLEAIAQKTAEPSVVIKSDKIIKSADKSQEKEYLRWFQDTLNKYDQKINTLKVQTTADLWMFADIYEQAINEFYNKQVPEQLLPLHKQEISLLIQEKEVWQKLANAESNPLEAILALRRYKELEKEFKSLQASIQWP